MWGDYAADESAVDPLIEPTVHEERVVRGGAFKVPAFVCRSYVRTKIVPAADGGSMGLRPARALPEDD